MEFLYGTVFFKIFSAVGASTIGWVFLALCAGVGFIIGQVKIPESNAFALFKKTGGEYIRDIIAKYLAFRKKRQIYLYDETNYAVKAVTDDKKEEATKKS